MAVNVRALAAALLDGFDLPATRLRAREVRDRFDDDPPQARTLLVALVTELDAKGIRALNEARAVELGHDIEETGAPALRRGLARQMRITRIRCRDVARAVQDVQDGVDPVIPPRKRARALASELDRIVDLATP